MVGFRIGVVKAVFFFVSVRPVAGSSIRILANAEAGPGPFLIAVAGGVIPRTLDAAGLLAQNPVKMVNHISTKFFSIIMVSWQCMFSQISTQYVPLLVYALHCMILLV